MCLMKKSEARALLSASLNRHAPQINAKHYFCYFIFTMSNPCITK